MTSSLRRLLFPIALAGLSLAPLPARAVTTNACSFPSPLPTFSLNQNAFEALGSVIRLTDDVASETGSAFMLSKIPITATTSLHAYFRVQLGPNAAGGDGLAFVMHNAAVGAQALGSGNAGLGYAGITPSVIVELDTFQNAGDTNGNHVGLMLNGVSTTHTATGVPSFTMAGAGILSVWVDYDGTAKSIGVYLSQTTTKPGTPVLSHALNLYTQLGSAGQMYVGFTAATASGTEINEHDVYELEISTDGVPCSCEGDAACGGATPACAASGICAVCSATNKTACTGATPVCNVPVNTCVGCLTNTDCAAPKPICDKTTLSCRACTSNADCGGSTPQCATTGSNAGSCVLCVADASCPPATPRCTSANTCVQCLSAGDCGGNTPLCKAGVCKPCASDADCGGAAPACEVWGACGQCSATNGSACTGATAVCDFPTGTCVACEFNSDCSGNAPTCDSTKHTCGPCQSNADCAGSPGGPACVTSGMKAGTCVLCTADSDCAAPTPKCDTVANQCVACLSSADCAAPTPVCDTSKQVCVACLSNADCTGAAPICNTSTSTCSPCQNDYAASNPGPLACPTATLPACQPSGTPLAGTCTVCSSVNNSACVTQPTTPVCVPSAGTCGCGKDADCNFDSYCDTSTVATGVCTPGCRVIMGTNNCASGKYCTTTDGTVGTCATEPCNKNADCSAPNDVCNTLVQPHVCVQCLNDTDCTAPQICDATATHCVACTPGRTMNCDPNGAGAACLASEMCGCATDADCGNGTSGRICDPTAQTCVSGCRGVGGNGCPSQDTCTSTTTTPGQCQPGSGTSTSSAASSSSSGMGGAGGGAQAGAGGAGGAHVVSQSTGCSCRTAGDGGTGPGLAGLAAVLALLLRRRRAPHEA